MSNGRARIWLWVVLVGWLAAVAVLWPAAQRMGERETDRASIELPSGADSTLVREVLDAAGDDHDESAVLLLTRPGGLSAADREWFGAVHRELADRPYVLGEPVESTDRAAVLLPMTFHDPEDMVAGARAAAKQPPAGATVHVTGPAAIEVDADDIEAGTDGRLLAATALVVVVLLLITYRSPVLWLLPLLSVAAALVLSQALITGFAELGGEYSGLTGKILTVLVFGVGTDYALLLVARYREELTRHAAPYRAMAQALRRTAGTVAAAAATVIGGVMCLMLASVPETRALGPTLALAVAATAVVMLTLFPALLVCCGRWIFWPRIPRPGAVPASARLWERVASAVAARPVRAMLISALLLLSLGQGVGALQWGIDPLLQFRTAPESVTGLRTAGEHFPADGVDPIAMIARPADAARAREILTAQPGVLAVETTADRSGFEIHEVRVTAPPFTRSAQDTVAKLRKALSGAGSPALLGGAAAETLDSSDAARRDLLVVGPAILAVIALVLLAMLRSVRLAAGLLGAVLLTALSAAGITIAASRYVFDFAGLDARIPLFALVFVIAVGVDYSIFLLQRYREEKHGGEQRLRAGERGPDPVAAMRRAMAATGGVVTSAGVVLAATFLVLTTLPLVALTQLGLAVAAGILLDTFVVRTVLMPALVMRMDRPAVTPSTDRPLTPVG